MTRASLGTGLPVLEDMNGIETGSANDDSLEVCDEMVVGQAVDSPVL
jgi:hypothetical protein